MDTTPITEGRSTFNGCAASATGECIASSLTTENSRLVAEIAQWQTNMREARDAQALVREEIERHYVGALPSSEWVDTAFLSEAEVQVRAIVAIASHASALAQQKERLEAALREIAMWQREKCETAGTDLLFALLEMKIDQARAALAASDAEGEQT